MKILADSVFCVALALAPKFCSSLSFLTRSLSGCRGMKLCLDENTLGIGGNSYNKAMGHFF